MLEDHVTILNSGAVAWNLWRVSNEGNSPDLSDLDFYYVGGKPQLCEIPEYEGFDFSNSNLNRVSLRNCIFSDCDFSCSSIHFSDLVDAYFTRCSFRQAELGVSKIGSAEFIECDFTDADLSYCSAEDTSFVGSKLMRTKLNNMSLVKNQFFECRN